LVDNISLKRNISFQKVNNVGIWGQVSNVLVKGQLLRKNYNCLTIFIQSWSDPAMNMLKESYWDDIRCSRGFDILLTPRCN
jgi:hypothetical protein